MGRGVRGARDGERSRRRAQALLFGLLGALCAVALAACGGGGQHFADVPRPPTPVDLSVYINNRHVAISPAKVGAGPVVLYVTNQASRTETLTIRRAGAAVASSGPINSGQTAQVSADLRSPGSYAIATGGPVRAARLRIGKPRPNADNVLLQP